MNDPVDIGYVHPHPEGLGRHQHIELAVSEAVVNVFARRAIETGVEALDLLTRLAEAPLPAQMNQINIRRCADRQF